MAGLVRRAIAVPLASLVASVACATGAAPAATSASPAASAVASKGLTAAPASAAQAIAKGTLSKPPDLPLRMNVGHAMQAAGATITHMHEVAFIYAVSGPTQVALSGAAMDLAAGQAVFVPAGAIHTHANPGTTSNDWYYMSIAPASAPLPPPTIKLEYKTPDIAETPAGATSLVLTRLDLPPQTTFAVKVHALQLSYQFAGDVMLHEADGTTVASKAGHGDYFAAKPNVTAIDNVGTTTATILIMTLDVP